MKSEMKISCDELQKDLNHLSNLNKKILELISEYFSKNNEGIIRTGPLMAALSYILIHSAEMSGITLDKLLSNFNYDAKCYYEQQGEK